ncbi:MAG: formimidoylglutamase [Bacteroidota bacterium]
MKDISIYFKARNYQGTPVEERLSHKIIAHTEGWFPELEKNSIALISCPEYRNGNGQNAALTESACFDAFAELNTGEGWNFNIYDLGIIAPGNEIKDTYFALSQVVAELVKNNILPVVLGGTQDLTFALYQAYQHLEQMVNLTNVDYAFDLGNPDENIASGGYISQIMMHRPCYLFNVSTIGIQAPYVKKSEMDLFEKLYFDVCRLGEFNADFKVAEPLLRNSDILSLDLDSVRSSDYNSESGMPNGFYANQICQVAKYAGISDKLAVFGIFNLIPNDTSPKNNKLVAEIMWYFIDGFAQRKGDFPIGTKRDYTKFNVHLEGYDSDLVFYKSPKSNRWWMEVPFPPKNGVKYERHHLVPCNFEDYQAAMQNEMPNLWWKTYQKLV